MSPLPNQAFTTRYQGRALRLTNEVEVFPAFQPNTVAPAGRKYRALYDTGATHSTVSPNVVQELNLPSIGARRVGVGGGFHDTTSHLINIKLPSNVLCTMVQVAQLLVPSGEDVIIGMDILTAGDFAVTHQGGNSVFSFRVPSVECIDFVSEIQDMRAKSTAFRPSKNGLCRCGSGKKFKSCCGRRRS